MFRFGSLPHRFFYHLPIALVAGMFLIALAGCGGSAPGTVTTNPIAATPQTPSPNGRAMGGQQPVYGGTVQLWQVNTDGSGAAPMLSSAVTTDINGYFTLTGLYRCPSPSTQVYLTVTGGNPGAGNNAALGLMAALGPCGSLSPSTYVIVNEVTTVASVWALQQFMGATFGVAGAEDIAVNTLAQSTAGMINAFSTVPVLVTLSQGLATSNFSNATLESARINTIANILSVCVNSNGTGTCADLFAAVTPSGDPAPGDTIQAALYMAQNPANNVAQIYSFAPAIGAPFLPDLTTQPFDWTLAVTYAGSGLNIPYQIAADAGGNVWIANSPGSPNNGLVELGTNGQPAAGSPFLSGSSSPLSGPRTVAPDTLGNVWIANHGSSANDLVSFPGSGSTFNTYIAASGCLPETVAIDGINNAYFACGGTGFTNLFEFANTGSVTSPVYSSAATQFQAVGSSPQALAVDTSGNVWVANHGSNSVSEFPSGFTPSTAPITYSLASSPNGIAVDHAGNLWTATGSTLSELVKSGSSYTVSNFSGGGLNSPSALAIDGSGNIWVANSAYSTISGTNYVSVSEFSNNGTAITEATSSNTPDIPGGYAHTTTANAPSPSGIAVDPSGNVWITGCGSSSTCTNLSFVMELVGAATPVVTPLSAAVAGNYLGCCSFTPASPGGTVPVEPGYISLQTNAYSPLQEGGSLSFLVTRIGGSSGTVGVSYATSNGSAIAGTDYTSTSGTLSWSSGDTSVRTITVPWTSSTNYTASKTFTLTLSGATGGAGITPYPTTLVSVSDQVTSTAPPFTGTNPPFYITPPSTHFNLTSPTTWKVQLPVDIYGGNGGTNQIQFASTEVTSLTGFSDPYYYLNSSNQIVFTAPSDGAVTTPGAGTNDARSEFRELYSGPGSDSNSDWYGDTDSGAGGTMTGICKFNSVSVDTDAGYFAQIHGQNNPFIILLYRPGYSDIEIQVENTSAATSSTRTELVTGVSLGDTISYSLTYSAPSLSGAGTITVLATDTTTNSSLGTKTIAVDSSWSSQGQYFKLGAYSGANHINNPAGDQTQVVYSSWAITH